MKTLLFMLSLIFLFSSCKRKANVEYIAKANDDVYEKFRKMVLSEGKIGEEFLLKLTKKEVDELSVIYIGNIKMRNGAIIKFIRSVNYFGLYNDAKRTNGQIHLYDSSNNKIGMYYVGGENDTPSKIQATDLVFDYYNNRCNKTTLINFSDSIPQRIFIKCTDNGGDLYEFTK